ALGPADLEGHRVRYVHPAGGERSDDAVLEEHEGLARLVAVPVAPGYDPGLRRDRLNVAAEPHHDVEHVRAEVAEAPDAGDLRVRHPAPVLPGPVRLVVEPAAQRS